MVASSGPHCLFAVSVECRAKVRDAEASVASQFTDEWGSFCDRIVGVGF